MPADPVPPEPVPPEPVPPDPVPAEPMPADPMPAHPVPADRPPTDRLAAHPAADPRRDGPLLHRAGVAAIVYAIASLTAATLEAIVLDFSIVSPADLVADVTTMQVPWVVAQALFIAQQPLLTFVLLGFWTLGRRGPRPALIVGTAQLGLSALLFVMSGVFHGVFGWHVSALQQLVGEDRADAERLAEIVHALGDTTFYVAIAATATAMIAWLAVMRDNSVAAGGSLPVGLRRLAIAAVIFQLVEFGYFLLPGLALTAPVGIACQAAWYIWLGRLLRGASR